MVVFAHMLSFHGSCKCCGYSVYDDSRMVVENRASNDYSLQYKLFFRWCVHMDYSIYMIHFLGFMFDFYTIRYTVWTYPPVIWQFAPSTLQALELHYVFAYTVDGQKKRHSNGSSRYILYILSINNLPNKFFVLPHSVDGQLLTAQNAWCLFSSRLDTPKTNISSYPLKTDDWKMNFHLKGSFFSGHVNFRSVCVF